LSISNRLVYANRNKTESFYAYPERNTFFEIHGADDEEKVHGLTQNVAWLNEPYKISKDTFDQIDQRCDLIFIDWNPKRSHWIEELSKRDNAIVIHSTYKDNPFCPEEQRIKIESYQPIEMCSVVINNIMSEHEALYYDCKINERNLALIDLLELQRCQRNESQSTSNKYK
jgi:phage terminase large subunit